MRYLLVALLLILSGCATGTRVVQYGAVAPSTYLVMLVVTDSLDVVDQKCKGAPRAARARLVGCQSTQTLGSAPGQPRVRGVRIVRYAESIPSPLTLEIEAHELCHAVAALQSITDPCHAGNNGEVDLSHISRVRSFSGAVSR